MDDKEKKEAIDATGVENETEGEEKKDNAFKRFWKKTKQSVNDAVLESKIESSYNKAHNAYTVYGYEDLFSKSIYGEYVDDSLIFFGELEIKPYSVIVCDESKTAYYALESEKTTVKAIVDGVEYERPGMKVKLDENVEEVKVVKAGKKYFLYKGKE